MNKKPLNLFTNCEKPQKFAIENALGMYASSFVTLPAHLLYEKDALVQYEQIVKKSHIYLIGYTEEIELLTATQDGSKLTVSYNILGEKYDLDWDLPEGYTLKSCEGGQTIEDPQGRRGWISMEDIGRKLNSMGVTTFDVQYIGQSYGKDGSRNAVDRLLKHETLQKISLKGNPKGYELQLLLLEVEANAKLFTVMNPTPEINHEGDAERISAGLNKVFNPNQKEQITLYEASLIRYFYPKYNKEFKDSFPSTNLKVLKDCYDKDFLAVVAEIAIDELPWRLKSQLIPASYTHSATHDLHNDDARKAFFFE